MQRRLIARPSHPHRCADQKREKADRREHEIHRARLERRRQRDVERLARAEPQQLVREARAFVRLMMERPDVGRRADRCAVHANQDVAPPNPRCVTGRSRDDHRGRDAFSVTRPKHAVVDLVPPRAQPHVLEPEDDQDHSDGDREQGAPGKPPIGRGSCEDTGAVTVSNQPTEE